MSEGKSIEEKYPHNDFFDVETSPELEKAIEEEGEVIDVEATEVIEEVPQLEAPQEEFHKVSGPDGFPLEETPPDTKGGIDFEKRTKKAVEKNEQKQEEPKAEEPKKEEPKAEEPKAEEPKAEETPTEESNPDNSPEEEQAPQSHQADIVMRTTVEDERAGTLEEQEEVLAQVEFPNVPAKVFFKKGLTRNLGNFESYRVDVGIEMPCSSDKATVQKYVLEGGKVVEHRLALEIQKAQRLYGNGGNSVFDRVNVNL